MHGIRVTGRTVAQVLAMLRHRGVSVPRFNYAHRGYARNLRSVPGTWFVYDAVPWAPQQVMLFVGPTRTPHYGSGRPVPGTPRPSPTAARVTPSASPALAG
jgi:hypothetical protein